jgi:hypothetical protein
MKAIPPVSPAQWIQIGATRAVACAVDKDLPNAIEVVYMDRGMAVHEYAVWERDRWQFAASGGGRADRSGRLRDYVAILKTGKR